MPKRYILLETLPKATEVALAEIGQLTQSALDPAHIVNLVKKSGEPGTSEVTKIQIEKFIGLFSSSNKKKRFLVAAFENQTRINQRRAAVVYNLATMQYLLKCFIVEYLRNPTEKKFYRSIANLAKAIAVLKQENLQISGTRDSQKLKAHFGGFNSHRIAFPYSGRPKGPPKRHAEPRAGNGDG